MIAFRKGSNLVRFMRAFSNVKSTTFGVEKDYDMKDYIKEDTFKPEPFLIPDELMKFSHNDQVRDPVEKLDPYLAYYTQGDFLQNRLPTHSAYVNVRNGGKTYHLFDINKKTLGEVAQRSVIYLTGKYKPIYNKMNSKEIGDIIVIVNAGKIKVTGRKRQYKKYYHHTGHPGGLITQDFKWLQKNNPDKIIMNAIWNMMPKNDTTRELLKRVHIFTEPYHTMRS